MEQHFCEDVQRWNGSSAGMGGDGRETGRGRAGMKVKSAGTGGDGCILLSPCRSLDCCDRCFVYITQLSCAVCWTNPGPTLREPSQRSGSIAARVRMLLVSFTAIGVRSGDDAIGCSWRRDVTSSCRTLPPVVSGGSFAGRLTVTMSAGVAGRLHQQSVPSLYRTVCLLTSLTLHY